MTVPAPAAPTIYREHRYLVWAFLILVIAVVVPRVFTSTPHQYLVDIWLIYAMAGLGFYWVYGLAGRFAFCQTFMMALGGYFSDWVTARLGPNWFLLSLLSSVVVTAFAALLIGLVLSRSTMFYFAIGTLAVSQVGNVVFQHTTSFSGANGEILNVPAPELFGHTLTSYLGMFWMLVVILAAAALLGCLIERSPLRRETVAARDNPDVARTLGIRVGRIQLVFFMLGSALGGLSGALLGSVTGSTSTDSFGTTLAIGIFLMLLIGGSESVWGPVVGAAFYVAIPQWLSGLSKWQNVIYGGLLLLVIIAFPYGIVGAIRSLSSKVRAAGGPSMAGPTTLERLRGLLPVQAKEAGDAD